VKTNIDVIKQFVDVRIDVTAEARDAVRIDVNPEPR
jgi:hypothetical protein